MRFDPVSNARTILQTPIKGLTSSYASWQTPGPVNSQPLSERPDPSGSLFNENDWQVNNRGYYENRYTGELATRASIDKLIEYSDKLASGTKWRSLPDDGGLNWEDSGLGSEFANVDLDSLSPSQQRDILETLVTTPSTSRGGWYGLSSGQKIAAILGIAGGTIAGLSLSGGGAAGASAGGGSGSTALQPVSVTASRLPNIAPAVGGGTAAATGGGAAAASGLQPVSVTAERLPDLVGGATAARGGLVRRGLDFLEQNPEIATIGGQVLAGAGDAQLQSDLIDERADAESRLQQERQELVSRNYRGLAPGGSFRSLAPQRSGVTAGERFDSGAYMDYEFEYDPKQQRIVKVPKQ